MKKIHSIKWMLMGIALILFTIPFMVTYDSTISTSGLDFATVLITFCIFSPFIGLIFCIYGFLKKDE